MNPKMDSQNLRRCLSEYFFVGSSLTTKIMSKNYLNIFEKKRDLTWLLGLCDTM